MNQYITNILSDLNEDLAGIEIEEQDLIRRSENAINVIQEALTDLRSKVTTGNFDDEAGEIRFFKELLPEFYSRLIYHLHVFHLESRRPSASIKLQRKLLHNELKDIALFCDKHRAFLQYYKAGNTYLDRQYFVRNQAETIPPSLLYDCSLVLDTSFCTTYSVICSRLKAFDQLQSYILKELILLDNKAVQVNDTGIRPKKWKPGPFALTEIGYFFYLSGAIPGTLKEVMEFLERCFDTKIGNYSRILQHMRIRKGERATFLVRGTQLLYEHMDQLDEKS